MVHRDGERGDNHRAQAPCHERRLEPARARVQDEELLKGMLEGVLEGVLGEVQLEEALEEALKGTLREGLEEKN